MVNHRSLSLSAAGGTAGGSAAGAGGAAGGSVAGAAVLSSPWGFSVLQEVPIQRAEIQLLQSNHR